MLAEQLAAQGRLAEGDSILRDVISILERMMGPEHSRVGRVLITRGRVRAAMGRRREAEADLRRALSIGERTLGPKHRWVGVTTALLGDIVERANNTESDALFARSAEILRSLPPSKALDTRAAYAALADHYRAKKITGDEDFFR